MEKIYVVGHLAPDLDSVASAFAYAYLRQKKDKQNKYIPACAGKVNKETAYLLKKAKLAPPTILKNVAQKKVILVDHNEFSQAVKGIEEAQILGVVDHHKINFHYSQPLYFSVKPWGACCTIIAQQFAEQKVAIPRYLALLMLGAILVDTVITQSPTCTDYDRQIIKELAKKAQIKDWKKFGREIFEVRSQVKDLSPEEIIKSDFKDFSFSAGKVGVGQVETVNLTEFKNLEEKLFKQLEKIKQKENYHTIILFITDILKKGSLFLVASQDFSLVEKALGEKGNKFYLAGVMSRKKQVAPLLEKVFNA